MTQYDQGQYYGHATGDPNQPQGKTSALAIASLICSLICCLPITTLLGVLLGVMALVSIGNNPMKRGKGLAIAGILLGIVFTAGQAYFGVQFYRGWQMFTNAPYHALEPGFQGDYAAMRNNFGPAAQTATDAEAQAFVEELRQRYGELQGSEVDFAQYQGMQQPGPGQTAMTMPWVLIFDNGRMDAELTWSGDDQGQSDSIIFRDITIIDPTEGNLTFPASVAPAAGPTNGESAADETNGTDATEGDEPNTDS